MATVKEIKLMKDGAMVTPVTLVGSVKNLDGTDYSSHTHDGRYYTESEIDSKVSTLNAAISGKAASKHTHAISDISSLQSTLDGKAASSHSHFSVTSSYTMNWVSDSEYEQGGYYKITVPDCPLGKMQICHFTYEREFDADESVQFYLPSNSNMYFVFSTSTNSSNGSSKSSYTGKYVKGGTNFDWGEFSAYIGYGSSVHTVTVAYARIT